MEATPVSRRLTSYLKPADQRRSPRCRLAERATMGLDDKIKNKAQQFTGKGKEKTGEVTGDKDLQAEGQADQASGNLKQAGEKVKDVFKS